MFYAKHWNTSVSYSTRMCHYFSDKLIVSEVLSLGYVVRSFKGQSRYARHEASSFHPRESPEDQVSRLVARLISGSRSGWVGIEPSAPKIYDVWRRKNGKKERKVNKNLGEITVPRGKLRLISCSSVFLSSFFQLPLRFLTILCFPHSTCLLVLYSTRCRATKRVLLLRAVTTYRPRKRGLRQIVTYFTFFPKGSRISFLDPPLPSFYPILFSPRRRGF